jgi:Zn finger protein HypA/HybF involved in hydrogenase expression
MSKDFKRPVGDELLTICPHCGSKNVKIVNTKDDQETTLMDEMICRDCAHA